MTVNHRAEAERIVHGVLNDPEYPNFEEGGEKLVLAGLVHATLARDEDHAATTADLRDATRALRRREYAMREAVSTHIAKALASREPARWKAGRDLAQALDEADCNMDDLIDSRLSDDGYDTKTPWTAPAPLIRRDDPWAPKPDITADVPESVRLVLADRLARALLGDGDGQSVARTLAFALKNEGADITGDIEKRITELTLGRDPSEPPF